MSTTPSETALKWLRAQLDEMGGFRNATTRDVQFKQWRQNTLTVIQRIWPGVTERSRRFKKVPFAPASNLADSREMRESFERGCAEAEGLLSHWIQDIEEHGVRHEPAETTQASVDVADYATTLELDQAPTAVSSDPDTHEEVPTLDLSEVPQATSEPGGPQPHHAASQMVDLPHDGPAPASPPLAVTPSVAPPAPPLVVTPSVVPPPPPTIAAVAPPAPPLVVTPSVVPPPPPPIAAVVPPVAAVPAPPARKAKKAAPKSKSRLKDMLGMAHLSAAQGADDHSANPPAQSAPAPEAFPSPPAFVLPPDFPSPPPYPPPPPAASIAFPAPPPVAEIPLPAPPAAATPFPAPPPVVESSFPAPPPLVAATPPLPTQLPMADAAEDLEDLEAPDERVFPQREIDLDAQEGLVGQTYEAMIEQLENETPASSIPFATLTPPPSAVEPPTAANAPPDPTPPKPATSAFPAPAPLFTEPPAEPAATAFDPASLLQVVSVEAPRPPASDSSITVVQDEIGPGRFSGRTAPVAALAAQLDHMDIPPIDRIALKRFLLDLALRLESDNCAWVDLRAAIITMMEYPQLARRALPALLPFLDKAA